jgi:hypothetical protein
MKKLLLMMILCSGSLWANSATFFGWGHLVEPIKGVDKVVNTNTDFETTLQNSSVPQHIIVNFREAKKFIDNMTEQHWINFKRKHNLQNFSFSEADKKIIQNILNIKLNTFVLGWSYLRDPIKQFISQCDAVNIITFLSISTNDRIFMKIIVKLNNFSEAMVSVIMTSSNLTLQKKLIDGQADLQALEQKYSEIYAYITNSDGYIDSQKVKLFLCKNLTLHKSLLKYTEDLYKRFSQDLESLQEVGDFRVINWDEFLKKPFVASFIDSTIELSKVINKISLVS